MDYIRYKVGTASDLNWFVYWEPGPWEQHSSLPGVSIVLDQVRLVFERCFGAEYIRKFPTLAVLHTHGAPMTYRENGLIFIQAARLNWHQCIYQFAHELCHFMIPSSPISTLRWLEETICETAALFTLTKIHNMWSTSEEPPSITNPAFTAAILGYIADQQERAITLGTQSLSAFITSHLATLEENCYLRDHNRTVANAILPLFLEHPSTWSAIPLLCEVRAYSRFREGLLLWQAACPTDTKEQIGRLIDLLTTK